MSASPQAQQQQGSDLNDNNLEEPSCRDSGAKRPDDSGTGDEASSPKSPRADSAPIKIVFNKRKIDLQFSLGESVLALKQRLQEVTGVPVGMQKLMFRGLCQDEQVLSDIGVSRNSKLMLVGSTPDSLIAVQSPPQAEEPEKPKVEARAETRLCQRDQHRRVLDKYGKPDDLVPGLLNRHEPLPPVPLSGMYNKQGAKVRLTFKLEIDELWIGTKERTNKIPMNTIRRVVSEPIDNNQAYHIMGIQLGPTEQSMYWVYWVPCQYVRAVKNVIGS